jgi:hypothetical protein
MEANQNSSQKLAYILKSTRRPLFQLSQDRTDIAKISSFGTGLEISAETRNSASRTTYEIDDKNRIKEQFISS